MTSWKVTVVEKPPGSIVVVVLLATVTMVTDVCSDYYGVDFAFV